MDNLTKKLWQKIDAEIATRQVVPRLYIFLVGDDAATAQFVGIKKRQAEKHGITVVVHQFPEDIPEEDLSCALKTNQADWVDSDGVIIQLPLPAHINADVILDSIPEAFDIDVLGAVARQNFRDGKSAVIPPVAGAIAAIGSELNIDWFQKNIVLNGYGRLVGQPCAGWLERRGLQYKVIDAESESSARKKALAAADIIISGAGQPHCISAKDIQSGVVIFDAGSGLLAGKIAGDVDPECDDKVDFMTPTPGGVGPLTVVVLFMNLLRIIPKEWL